jgi:hypothetical protein
MNHSVTYLLPLLHNIQRSENDIRNAADEGIKNYMLDIQSSSEGLISVALDTSQPVHIRQLAIILINKHVKERIHELPDLIKTQFFNLAIGMISNPDGAYPELLLGSIAALARLVSNANPQDYQPALEYVKGIYQTANLSIASRTCLMRCFMEIALDVDIDRQAFLLSAVFPLFPDIFEPSSRQNTKILRYTAKLVTVLSTSFLSHRASADIEGSSPAWQNIGSMLYEWTKMVYTFIEQTPDLQYSLTNELDVFIETLQSIPLIFEAFPDDCESAFLPILSISWKMLIHVKDVYSKLAIEAGDGHDDENDDGHYNTDGDRYSIIILIKSLLDLLNISILSSAPADISGILLSDELSSPSNGSEPFLQVIVEMCRLPASSQKAFLHDGNAFISIEEDNDTDESFRHISADLLRCACMNRIYPSIRSLIKIASDRFSVLSSTASLQSFTLPLLGYEASLWAIGSLSKVYINSAVSVLNSKAKRPKKSSSKSIAENDVISVNEMVTMLQSIVSSTLTCAASSSLPIQMLLSSRVLWLFGRYKALFSSSMKISAVTHGLSLISISTTASCTTMPAPQSMLIRAIGDIIRPSSKASILHGQDPNEDSVDILSSSYRFANILQASLAVIPQLDERSLHYSIETIEVVLILIRRLPETTSSLDIAAALPATIFSEVIDRSIEILNKYKTDPMIHDMIDSLLTNLQRLRLKIYVFYESITNLFLQKILPFATNLVSYLINHGTRHVHYNIFDIIIQQTMKLLSFSKYEASDHVPQSASSLLWHGRRDYLQFAVPMLYFRYDPAHLTVVREVAQLTNAVLSSVHTCESPTMKQSLIPDEHILSFIEKVLVFTNNVLLALLGGLNNDGEDENVDIDLNQALGPALGLLVHCMVLAEDLSSQTNQAQLQVYLYSLELAIDLMKRSSSKYIQLSILMTLIHLSARNIQLLSVCLQMIQQKQAAGSPSILADVLAHWTSIHNTFTTNYCNRISTIGLCRLINFFHHSDSAVNHHIASTLMHLVLSSLPRQIQAEEHAMNGMNDEEDDDDDDLVSDSDEDDFDEADSDALNSAIDIGSDDDNGEIFAPAERYLSDMIPDLDQESSINNLSDNLVFNDIKADPLNNGSLQENVIQFIFSLCHRTSTGSIESPAWFQNLCAEDQHLIQAFIKSAGI